MSMALLMIDMQNGFCQPDGSASRAGVKIPRIDRVTSACAELLDAVRSRGVPVIYTRHCYRPGHVTAPAAFRAFLAAGALEQGSWDAEVIDELAPGRGDHLVDKPRFDAFAHTDLELLLRGLGAGHVLLAGVLTNICVETTARAAQQLEFQVSVASDATASTTDELHTGALAGLREVYVATDPWARVLTAAL
ncbi:MAG TPA: isochorismatase family cysteine hydrolase [Streptosporangiaceae bacterium]|jgi:ureidoacrylate peracid hydrolase